MAFLLKSLSKRLLWFFILFTLMFSIYTFQKGSPTSKVSSFNLPSILRFHSCSPEDYSAGEWIYSPHATKTNMTKQEDALQFSGFSGCASSREVWWHLGADNKEQWDRFPGAQSWAWTPGKKCTGWGPLNPKELIRVLVEDGGWYLVGDSVTENHFFSLSCFLHGHVVATPEYTEGKYWDRGWPQNLYLSPISPLVASIKLPKQFDIMKTPLVTFRRIDILFSKEELVDIHRDIQPAGTKLEDDSLFGEQPVWTVPTSEYMREFLAPLPKGNYNTMVVSTGGHWTVETFAKARPSGIEGVLNLFRHASRQWADMVEDRINTYEQQQPERLTGRLGRYMKRKRVVVRAYLPGHEGCHDLREPWKTVEPFKWNWWNWGEIWRFNEIFDTLLSNRKEYPDIHYIGIDRPARLRPDAHATGDCLHFMTGAGVLEEWTHYIWHYITREI